MEKNFTKLLAILIVPALYFIFISAFTKSYNMERSRTLSNVLTTDTAKFVNMIQNMDYVHCDSIWIGKHLNEYKELGYNAAHVYPSDNNVYGKFDTVYSQYHINKNNELIDSVHNRDLKFFYEQVKFSYLCYAQRLIYEVPLSGRATNDGFCFQRTSADVSSDSERTVLHSIPSSSHLETLLCDSIYENLQHSDFFGRQHDDTLWYLKPMVRADLTGIHDTIPIFKIKVINFAGYEDTSIIIKARNFRNNGVYNNNYTERFYIGQNLTDLFISGNKTNGLNKGKDSLGTYLKQCKVDFKIYTYGYVDFWFDKLTVDDFYANKLFNPNDNYDDIISDELTHVGNNINLYSYYMDEVAYSQLSGIKYVMDKVNTAGGKFMVSEANWMAVNVMRNTTLGHSLTLKTLHPRILNVFAYELWGDNTGYTYIPAFALNSNYIDARLPDIWRTNNRDIYNNYLQNIVLGSRTSGNYPGQHDQGSFVYQVCLAKKNIVDNSPNTMLYITPQMQGEMQIDSVSKKLISIREPLNEEIEVQTMLALSHGAQGLIGYVFQTKIDSAYLYNSMSHVFGLYGKPNDLLGNGDYRRIKNLYGQNKWEFMKKMNAKINKWIPTLDKTKWDAGYSVHSEGVAHYFISGIKSLYATTNGGAPLCEEDNIWADCNDEKYWEEAFFTPNDNNDKSKYFLMTNRRCAPEIAGIGQGDLRQLKVSFNANQLSSFNNWSIINVENDSLLITFDKNNPTYVDFGVFQPGEGKLYKITPAFQIGGTLAGDETLSGNINCEGIIYSNDHNITISPSTTISFSDSAGIEMNGGNFICGDNNSESMNVTLQAKDNNSNTWKGLVLSNCSSIGIYNTNISKITANDTAKAVLISNCNNVNIDNTVFNVGTNSGAIQAVYTEISEEAPVTFNVSNSSFVMGSSSYSAISIISNASSTLPVIIDWCNFTTSNENANAITLSGVTGGAIKNSTFTNFSSTINTLSSAIDLYDNTIIGRSNSTGVLCVDGSSISLSPSSGLYLGGYNYIRNYGGSSSNICSDNSIFNINLGWNNYDLNEIAGSKHLTGTFSGQPQLSVYASKNCFHKDSITNIEAVQSVVWNSNSDPVNFVFTDYNCELTPPENYQLFTYNGYSDTVYYRSGGEGGGLNPKKQTNLEENIYKSLKDTININLRKRNYLTVEEKAKQILTQYPDSLESIGMLQKLYVSSLNLDSTKIGITKTFLENLIATNAQNPGLIKRAFYFIQKCKVKLGQYQSALDGFQYIMTQNPYTYEGLVASWDYGATYLLMGTGGSYKGDLEQQTEELNTPADTLLSRMTKQDINNNINTNKGKSTTTSEQITKTFYEKVKNVTKDDKTTQEAKVKTLEKKIETSKNKTEKNDAITELAKMKQIKETVKIKKPGTVNVHITMMNDDIKKVFGIGKKSTNETTNKIIPTTYNLYQNYPNPFNPTTKIAYDIPRDAKVKLVIYDILGREMKTLVNNEFKTAGKYIIEFNGSNLASGIYFARILVNEGKDFMAVKKMVLLK